MQKEGSLSAGSAIDLLAARYAAAVRELEGVREPVAAGRVTLVPDDDGWLYVSPDHTHTVRMINL